MWAAHKPAVAALKRLRERWDCHRLPLYQEQKDLPESDTNRAD